MIINKNTVLQRRPLGRMEATLLTRLSTDGKTVFTIEDAQNVTSMTRGHLRECLSGLSKKRWIDRVKRGVYMIVPLEAGVEGRFTQHEFIIASHLCHPYYLSYWSALHHYEWTEQLPGTVCIATIRPRKDLEIHGVRYRFVQMREGKFFGFRDEWVEGRKVHLVTKEKAIIDSLDRPDVSGGMVEVAKSLWNARLELDWTKVIRGGIKAGNQAVLQRLGFLVEWLDIDIGRGINRLQKEISGSYAFLDPSASKWGQYVKRWRIRVNITEEELQRWRTH